MKTKDIMAEQFAENVMNTNKSLFESVKSARQIAIDTHKEYPNYSVQTATSFAIKRIKKAKSDETATDFKGFAIGKRIPGDTGKGPHIFGVMTGRTGIEVKTWKSEVDTGDKKLKFPTNAAVHMKAKLEQNDFTNKSEWVAANIMGRNQLTLDEIVTRLSNAGAIMNLDDIRKLIKKTDPAPVVMARVILAGANASKKFGSEDLQPIWRVIESNGKITAEGPNLSLRTKKTDGETMAWLRMTGTAPEYITLEDFTEIAKEVIERFDNPEDQAAYLGNAMEERPAIVIASISKIGGDQENGYAINMNVLALLEATNDSTPLLIGQQPLPEAKVEETPVIEEEPEKPAEDVPETEIEIETVEIKTPTAPAQTITTPVTEPAPEPVVEPVPAPVPEKITIIEKTPEIEEIEQKMLWLACLKCGNVPKNAMRSQKIEALKKTSIDDLMKMGASMKKFNAETVQQVYDSLIASV